MPFENYFESNILNGLLSNSNAAISVLTITKSLCWTLRYYILQSLIHCIFDISRSMDQHLTPTVIFNFTSKHCDSQSKSFSKLTVVWNEIKISHKLNEYSPGKNSKSYIF